ncbi:MAG: lipid-binding SYLF domain-containing protein [Candidatus Omnitrophica bacterium]|nr:lipid-binding SYLF domain-containing protein [Candidatus Omnitrophota bacterium]
MKRREIGAVLLLAVHFLLFSASVVCAAPPELDRRIGEAKRVLDEAMRMPEQSIPEELLAKCKAIAVYPSVLRGGYIFGARYGKGVVLKRDSKTGEWGPPAFSTIGGGSWGLQIGGQVTDLILVMMNERGLDGFLSSRVTLGAGASVAAGPLGRASEAATDLSLRAGIFSYSRSRGLFGGMAIDGAVVTQDNNSNAAYYGKPVTSTDILLGNAVTVQPSSGELVEALDEYSKRWEERTSVKAQ